MRVLVAEDEKDLALLISKKLKREGYSVDCVFDGGEAVDYLEMADYDCILLDIMMPVYDGLEVLSRIRNKGVTSPVIFLTAKDTVEDKITGLDSGANDYIVKPFSFDELLARIRANTRQNTNQTSVYKVCDLTLDTAKHRVIRAGREISLSAKEYQLLKYLMKNEGVVLSRDNIENHIWNFDYEGGTNVVDVYIRYLRQKIDEGFDKKLIKTVRGVGYKIGE
ncbi:MAG: response regulator transcription factor [Eubacterium sp.]|nr:response regulator transcription factor [Eubacterium sp.]